jgi:hypothetical protein
MGHQTLLHPVEEIITCRKSANEEDGLCGMRVFAFYVSKNTHRDGFVRFAALFQDAVDNTFD